MLFIDFLFIFFHIDYIANDYRIRMDNGKGSIINPKYEKEPFKSWEFPKTKSIKDHKK